MWVLAICPIHLDTSKGDGEDDCWVFDVDVTDSGCFCVLVDVSMGSEAVSRHPAQVSSDASVSTIKKSLISGL
ncbi:hypothetical protein Tco_1458464 [Tanacetum coccineum]